MKKMAITLIIILFTSISGFSQYRRVTNIPAGYNTADVAKYSKSFARKIMYTNVWLGNIHNQDLKLKDWFLFEMEKDDFYYCVPAIISWTEGEFPGKKNYRYEGVLMFDKYGCTPVFWCTYKDETQALGVGKRVYDLPQRNLAYDHPCPDAKWFVMPDGCLGDD